MINKIKKHFINALGLAGYQIVRLRDSFHLQREILDGMPVGTIFDVGANMGNTLAIYRKHFPDATIYGFEPFPECVEKMKERFRHDDIIRIVESGVGAEPGTAKLFVSGGKSTHSMMSRPTSTKSYHREAASIVGEIDIPMTSLDAFVEKENISQVDILKIDVEGAEEQVIKGAAKLLGSGGVSVVYLEVMFVPHYQGQLLFHQLIDRMNEFGYTLFDIPEVRRAANGQIRWGDAIFVSQSIRSDVVDRS